MKSKRVTLTHMPNMIVDTAKLSDRGQVVIPKEIRDELALKEGNRFIVIASEDTIILQRIDITGGRLRLMELVEKAKNISNKLGLRI